MTSSASTLSKSVSQLYGALSKLSRLSDREAQLTELRRSFEALSEELKPQILATLKASPPSRETGISLIDQYGWKKLYLRSFTFWYCFYMSWLWTQLGVRLDGAELERMFRIWVYGTLGYRLLDLFLDEARGQGREAIAGLWLIDEHERELREFFGYTTSTCASIHSAKKEWFAAELREKSLQGERCPVSYDSIGDLSTKAAPIFSLFGLALSRHSDSMMIQDYKDLVYRLVAVTQILDDLSDLEEDLAQGFFTLACVGLEKELSLISPQEGAERVRRDEGRMRRLYDISCDLATQASEIAKRVQDPLFETFAEYRLLLLRRVFFGKEVPDGPEGSS